MFKRIKSIITIIIITNLLLSMNNNQFKIVCKFKKKLNIGIYKNQSELSKFSLAFQN